MEVQHIITLDEAEEKTYIIWSCKTYERRDYQRRISEGIALTERTETDPRRFGCF